MQTEKFSISLPADMARMIRSRVESGAYASNSEVIRDALRLWQNHNQEQERRLESIRARINEAAASPGRITDDELGRHFDRRLAETEKKPEP
ncbi:MAG: type II toxin-antitoxin system ParD family antitoxin [Nitrococcus sp.]|nr:type II toxin-antitoxin system ParD family antitoxin [Nitrococcus sp.]